MNQTSQFSQQPGSISNNDNACLQFYVAYKTHELACNLIGQINHLVKNVQRHRGISMSLLAGDRAFEKEFIQLQRQVDKRLSLLHNFALQQDVLLSERDKSNIQLSWNTIREDWQGDKLTDNFELHSHFVEQLKQTSLNIAKQIETPIIFQLNPEAVRFNEPDHTGVPRLTKQIELLNFTCSLLPTLIESMAKIRGLASFAAASGGVGYEYDRRLRFLLQCARDEHTKVLQCAQRIHEILGGELDAKRTIGDLETKFLHLIELVTHDVLSGTVIKASSSQLFNLATVLIDKYWEVVDDGLDLLRYWQRGDLDFWVTL